MKIILSDGTIIKGLTTNSTVKFLTTIYTVTFKDWDASVLKTETLDPGIDATPPSNPSRTNYTFNGWSPAYTNVQGNLIITAQYIAHYLVRFKDWDGAILKSQYVYPSTDATPPSQPTRTDYIFDGWSGTYTNVTSNRDITATYIYSPQLYAFTSHTFIACGATGKNGPTFAQMKSTYSSEIWELNTAWFNSVKQGYQLWTVPKDGDYTIESAGARGGTSGSSSSGIPGKGAKMKGTFTLTKGEKLRITVGQIGGPGTNYGAGGGGGAFVMKETGSAVSDIYVIAGGGGGPGYSTPDDGVDAPITGNGTKNFANLGTGGTNGSGGSGGTSTYNAGGGGGMLSNGGIGYSSATGGASFVDTAIGGNASTSHGYEGDGGFGGGGGCSVMGGGGGGYSGGAGGTGSNYTGGGAGGSYNNGSLQENAAGANNGEGYVIITQL